MQFLLHCLIGKLGYWRTAGLSRAGKVYGVEALILHRKTQSKSQKSFWYQVQLLFSPPYHDTSNLTVSLFLYAALARAEDKEAACAEWGKMLPVYFDMRTGIHHLLTEMGINSAAQQRHSRPSSTDDIVRIMELFTLENVWTQKASSLEYKYSGRYRELDRRGKELAEPFIYSWLNEGKQVMNMQLISEKDTLVAEEL